MTEPIGDGRTTCDGCSREGSLCIADMNTREVEILCWPCLMGRAVAVASEIAGAVDGQAVAGELAGEHQAVGDTGTLAAGVAAGG